MTHIPHEIFIAGIHTDAGKSLVAALLTQGLQADYWKPVQSGTTPQTDTEFVQQATGLPDERFHPESYRLEFPASPHASAAMEGLVIDPDQIRPPVHERPLIIEGAGGLMVPLTDDYLFLDWLAEHKFMTVLVIPTYLGCINHSLLSLEALKRRGIPLWGIVFNDGGRPESESVIERYAKAPVLARIPQLPAITPDTLQSTFSQHFSFPQ